MDKALLRAIAITGFVSSASAALLVSPVIVAFLVAGGILLALFLAILFAIYLHKSPKLQGHS